LVYGDDIVNYVVSLVTKYCDSGINIYNIFGVIYAVIIILIYIVLCEYFYKNIQAKKIKTPIEEYQFTTDSEEKINTVPDSAPLIYNSIGNTELIE
jgi:hypothetical protein